MADVSILKRIVWGVGASLVLLLSCLLCRFVFFEMHGMKDWPWILLIFGLTVLLISMFLFSQKVIICTATGYIIGFVVAVIFSSDYYATYYGPEIVVLRENNFWSIWTLAYLAVIVAGVLLAGTQRIRMGMQKRKNCE